MPWLGEGIPRNMKPARASQKLVGVLPVSEELHKLRELLRIFRADIGGLTDEVLGVLHATHLTVHGLTTETRVDDDRSNNQSRWLQQHVAAIGHVHHVLYRWAILWVLVQFAELVQFKV